jgi:ubiquinone/menaquinone biosynthesis C-methylase UbiE
MTDLETVAYEVVKNTGLKQGHTVVDFGCGHGTYTIPAAKIVGEDGKLYAVDKDKNALDDLMQKAQAAGLKNLIRIDTLGGTRIKLQDGFVDVVMLFDVLNDFWFSYSEDRRKLLDECYRVLKPEGILSVYPKHVESRARGEVEKANYYLESEYHGTFIHLDRVLESGQALNFRKKSKD